MPDGAQLEPRDDAIEQRRRRWLTSAELMRRLAAHQADPALSAELRALAPDSTDQLAWRAP